MSEDDDPLLWYQTDAGENWAVREDRNRELSWLQAYSASRPGLGLPLLSVLGVLEDVTLLVGEGELSGAHVVLEIPYSYKSRASESAKWRMLSSNSPNIALNVEVWGAKIGSSATLIANFEKAGFSDLEIQNCHEPPLLVGGWMIGASVEKLRGTAIVEGWSMTTGAALLDDTIAALSRAGLDGQCLLVSVGATEADDAVASGSHRVVETTGRDST